MKKMIILALLIFTFAHAFAAVPQLMNCQGKLLTASGAAYADGTYSMVFALYAVPTGGTALWSETNTKVQTKNGLFSVLLGSINNFGANLFNTPTLFLGVKVGADAEMTPRQQIVSTAFAFKAAIADTVPDGAITQAKLAPQQPWQLPVLQNGWINYNDVYHDIYANVAFYKDSMGIVHLRGLLCNGTKGSIMFTLPAGYRPSATLIVVGVACNLDNESTIDHPCRIDIDKTGDVHPAINANGWISLAEIDFRADQ